MAFTHRGGDRTQQFLLPPSLDEWLPQDHLARFVAGVVERLDLRDFARPARPDGKGRRSYDPKMLVALVLYAWCIGERSSRRIERRCVEEIPFRWLTGNEAPDHTTTSRFVKDRAAALEGLFAQVLRLAFASGMGKVGVVSVDSTRVAADASPQTSMTRERLEAEARRIREEHQRTDEEEDRLFGDTRGDELPPDLADPASRDARIAEALRQLEEEDARARADYEARKAKRDAAHGPRKGRAPTPPKPTERKANVTDPDCRIMRGPRAYGPSYNAQAAVSEDQLILATDVVQDNADNDQLDPMVDAVVDQLDALDANGPATVAADNGYWNPETLERRAGPELLVPPRRDERRPKLATRGPIPKDATLTQRMERRLATRSGKASYRKRATTVEPVFGQIKAVRGITRFRRRGLEAARSEWSMIGTTHNILKMWRSGAAFAH